MRLRPYKSCDAAHIAEWIQEEQVFLDWGGDRFGTFPIDASVIDNKYMRNNGDCVEEDNFYPWIALDEDGNAVGHFIMRYTGGDPRQLRFGWVVADPAIRGKGYGKQMLLLGLKYAFEILQVERVTLGVFEHNDAAHWCYKSAGFVDTEVVKHKPWNIVEMEILRKDYLGSDNE